MQLEGEIWLEDWRSAGVERDKLIFRLISGDKGCQELGKYLSENISHYIPPF